MTLINPFQAQKSSLHELLFSLGNNATSSFNTIRNEGALEVAIPCTHDTQLTVAFPMHFTKNYMMNLIYIVHF